MIFREEDIYKAFVAPAEIVMPEDVCDTYPDEIRHCLKGGFAEHFYADFGEGVDEKYEDSRDLTFSCRQVHEFPP